jgi:hypothetical protein
MSLSRSQGNGMPENETRDNSGPSSIWQHLITSFAL